MSESRSAVILQLNAMVVASEVEGGANVRVDDNSEFDTHVTIVAMNGVRVKDQRIQLAMALATLKLHTSVVEKRLKEMEADVKPLAAPVPIPSGGVN